MSASTEQLTSHEARHGPHGPATLSLFLHWMIEAGSAKGSQIDGDAVFEERHSIHVPRLLVGFRSPLLLVGVWFGRDATVFLPASRGCLVAMLVTFFLRPSNVIDRQPVAEQATISGDR